MKTKINLTGLLFLLSFVGLNAQTPYFYYYNGQKQYLELDTRYVFVSVSESDTANAVVVGKLHQNALRADIPATVQSRTQYKRFWAELSVEDSLSDAVYLAKLSEMKNAGQDIIVSPYFKNQYQDRIGLSNFFYVKLKSLSDTVLLRQETEKENAVIVYQNQFMPLWFVLSITKNSKYNAMETANRFYESGLFQTAAPDLMIDAKTNCINDINFEEQWALKNTGQDGGISGIDIKACEAWQYATGEGIVVCILDQGIIFSHPDLISNEYPLSFDCEKGIYSQDTLYGDHGQLCAGIIGASQNNGIGISGVAPDCKLMAVSNSLSGTPLSCITRADGINWAWRNGADVINNSWQLNAKYNIVDEAIDSAVTYGRGGKGTVIIYSSGNDNNPAVNYPASLPNVMAIGAITPDGQRKKIEYLMDWGSNYGNNLDVVSPGYHILTTGIGLGNAFFSGTSAAAPHASGVAALILSVNPYLTYQEVGDIIRSTAQKIRTDLYNYSGSYLFNIEMGYGLLDAEASVLKALNYWGSLTIDTSSNLCERRYAYLSYIDYYYEEILWKTSENIEIIEGQGGYQLYYRGTSLGAGWIECWVIRYGDTILVDKKDIEIRYPKGTLYANYSTNGNMQISSATIIEGTFTINSGHTVTIHNANAVYCALDAKIVINKGGKLIVDKTMLRSAAYCDNQTWQGIVVMGDDFSPQIDSLQGVVELINGATIRDAVCGIRAGSDIPIMIPGLFVKPRYKYYGGGIVRAEDANFINNQQAVHIAPYDDYFSNGILQNNKSYFNSCTFELNGNTIFTQAGKAQVELQGVSNMPFTNCTFADNRTKNNASDYTTGIYTNSSSIKIGSKPSVSSNYNDGCSFSGFEHAIHLSGSGINASEMYNSQFTDNHIGILTEGVGDFAVGNCQFQIPQATGYFTENIGIYLDRSYLYRIANNYFLGNDNGNGATGIVVQESGTTNHFIKNNTFENLCTGCLAIGNNSNGSIGEQSQGLVYQCNKFVVGGTDILVDGGSRIRYLQSGEKSVWATGNEFSYARWSIINGGDAFEYQHLALASHIPFWVTGTVHLKLKGGNCCAFYGYAGENYYTTAPEEYLVSLNSSYITAAGIYDTKKDDDIIVINWEDPDVMAIVEQLEMTVTSNDFTITINGELPVTDLEKQVVLYYELTNLKQYMDNICYVALDLLASDTLGLDMAQYRTWIGRFNTIESEYLLIETYISLGEFEEAEEILEAMPVKFPELDLESYGNYLDYFAAAQEIYALDLEEDEEFPPHLITELVRLSSNDDFVAIKAYSLGEMVVVNWSDYYSYTFAVHSACVCSYDNSSSIMQNGSGYNNTSEIKGQENQTAKTADDPLNTPQSDDKKGEITVKPNPTTGKLHITCAETLHATSVQIFDVVGKQYNVGAKNVLPNEEIEIDISHLANGMYFLKIQTDNGTVMKKVVKQ
ncbi:MAG: S8 family serine peptidase [Lentimicrobiaceae bacterium]|nr:S8 family serine peptidase [Lentimicrobiaceae bacterium]